MTSILFYLFGLLTGFVIGLSVIEHFRIEVSLKVSKRRKRK
jgi:hypothetical protein